MSRAEAKLAYGQICLDQGDALGAYTAFAQAARMGDSRGWNMIGRYYQCGWGGAVDLARAARAFERAAAAGDVWALFNLGDVYQTRPEPDAARAFSYYAQAAEKGLAKAQNMVGLAYEVGELVARDAERALAFYQAAGAGGDCWGAFNAGRICLARDFAAAKGWFSRALALADAAQRRVFLAQLETVLEGAR